MFLSERFELLQKGKTPTPPLPLRLSSSQRKHRSGEGKSGDYHDPSGKFCGLSLLEFQAFKRRREVHNLGKVPKILLNVTNQHDGDSPCLTPQEKLLNNIDTVEKLVMEELRKLKRTPSAKKAEREKRIQWREALTRLQ
ncbi:hypothetical protein ACS0TY_026845 [Phlomoides rotata]